MKSKVFKIIINSLILSLLIFFEDCHGLDLFERPDDNINFKELPPLPDDIPYDRLGKGKIVFERCNKIEGVIYVIDLDNQTSWGFGNEVIDAPAVSPDGQKIAFTSCTPYESENWTVWDVFVMGVKGNGCQNISHHEGQDGCPSWTADSQQVVFYVFPETCLYIFRQSPVEYPNDRVCIYEWCLTSIPQKSMEPNGPVSVSSKNELVFSTGTRIFRMDMNGNNLMLLLELSDEETKKYYHYHSPVWSPDGVKIAFIKVISNSEFLPVRYQIFVMDKKGWNKIIIRECKIYPGGVWAGSGNISICWSPDGRKLLFSKPHGDLAAHLYVINADGSNLTKVTTVEGVYDRSVSWSH